jgi:hypothetical protein
MVLSVVPVPVRPVLRTRSCSTKLVVRRRREPPARLLVVTRGRKRPSIEQRDILAIACAMPFADRVAVWRPVAQPVQRRRVARPPQGNAQWRCLLGRRLVRLTVQQGRPQWRSLTVMSQRTRNPERVGALHAGMRRAGRGHGWRWPNRVAPTWLVGWADLTAVTRHRPHLRPEATEGPQGREPATADPAMRSRTPTAEAADRATKALIPMKEETGPVVRAHASMEEATDPAAVRACLRVQRGSVVRTVLLQRWHLIQVEVERWPTLCHCFSVAEAAYEDQLRETHTTVAMTRDALEASIKVGPL